MTKSKAVYLTIAVLLIALVFSVWQNINRASEQDYLRKLLINHSYSALMNISRGLEGLIDNIDNNVTTFEDNRQTLIMLSHDFIRLDIRLTQYGTAFPPSGINRNTYVGTPFNFDYIAYTLTAGTGTANGVSYSGITADNTISANEVLYLRTLKDDIDQIIGEMVSPANPPNESQNLTSSQIDYILGIFFDKWSYHNEESPYFLLRQP